MKVIKYQGVTPLTHHFKRLLPAGLFLSFLALLPMFNAGCFRPAAALSFVNKENEPQAKEAGRVPLALSQVDPPTERSLGRYGSIIQKYSDKYDLDWRLVLAVMRHESRFLPTATSHRGAFGLMQIMPTTQLELAEKLGVKETGSPSNNIKAGTYHLKSLFAAFDKADEESRIYLTLAAYNAGLNRILDAQNIAAYLGDDPNNWESVRAALPLLSKRYQTLHQMIWESGRPRAGYFSDWRQTQSYVEAIRAHYDTYQVALR